jgi:formate-dependent nitrite reductase cytochrome c552 subunit
MRKKLGVRQGVFLVGIGLCLLLAGIYWLIASPDTAQATPPFQEGDPPPLDAEYVGTVFCRMCHTQEEAWHASPHAQMVRPASPDTILGDLTDPATVTITWPDGSERPITADDITFVLGGRYAQSYVSVMDRPDGTVGYYVLPMQWNIPQTEDQPGVWSPVHFEDWQDPSQDWRLACAGCHTTGLDGAQADETTDFAFVDEWENGAVEINIGCEACHGPGGAHRGDKGTIVKSPDAQICGQCHVQGYDPSGAHAYPVGYQPGLALDESVLVLTPEDDLSVWWPTGHARAYDQYAEWLKSGHSQSLANLKASDLAEDGCLRCHAGPAGDVTLAEAEYAITCVACHNPHPTESEASAETETLIENYGRCVACHNSTTPENEPLLVGGQLHHPVQEMYEGQPVVDVVKSIPSGHFSQEGGPSCVDCHMPQTVQVGEYGREGSHTLNTVLCTEPCDTQTDSCVICHTDLTPKYMQRFVQDTQAGVSDRLEAADDALANVPNAPDWVKMALTFVANDGSLGVHNYAYTDALLHAAEVELNLIQLNPITSGVLVQMEDSETCATCHRDEFQKWQGSPHATASTNDVFLQEFAIQGRPNYCMSCHASGYDTNTGTHSFEGVICSNCHLAENGTQHPPSPLAKAAASSDCGRCHSGAHAPTYDEWLVSAHKRAGIDCVDCHTPHDNGLLLGDVNATCGDCHAEALVDDIHMGSDMTCVDCHMSREVNRNGTIVRTTGHTMSIDPSTCAECHGNTHLLSVRESPRAGEDISQIQELENEIEDLKDTSERDRNSAIIGGALGTAILGAALFFLVRLRKLL